MHFVTHLAQRVHQTVAFALQVVEVDRHRVDLGERVLHDCVGKHVAGRKALDHESLSQLVAARHVGRKRDVAKALSGRQRALAVGVDQHAAWVERARRDHPVAVEEDAAVSLV